MKTLIRTTTIAAVIAAILSISGTGEAGRRNQGDIDFDDGVFYVTGTTGRDILYLRLVDDELEVILRTPGGSIDKDKKLRKVNRVVFETNGGRDRIRRLPGTSDVPVRVIRPPR